MKERCYTEKKRQIYCLQTMTKRWIVTLVQFIMFRAFVQLHLAHSHNTSLSTTHRKEHFPSAATQTHTHTHLLQLCTLGPPRLIAMATGYQKGRGSAGNWRFFFRWKDWCWDWEKGAKLTEFSWSSGFHGISVKAYFWVSSSRISWTLAAIQWFLKTMWKCLCVCLSPAVAILLYLMFHLGLFL